MTDSTTWNETQRLRADATDRQIIERLRRMLVAVPHVDGLRPPANYFERAAVVVAHEYAVACVAETTFSKASSAHGSGTEEQQ